MSEENWKTVSGYPDYEVSDIGRVRSHRGPSAYIFRPAKIRGYPVAKLRNEEGAKLFYVHRLVLEAFVGPCPDGMEACHGNGVRDDAALSNLRWDTCVSNHADRAKHGTVLKGSSHPLARLTDLEVMQIRSQRGFLSGLHLADMFDTSSSHVSDLQLGRQRTGT